MQPLALVVKVGSSFEMAVATTVPTVCARFAWQVIKKLVLSVLQGITYLILLAWRMCVLELIIGAIHRMHACNAQSKVAINVKVLPPVPNAQQMLWLRLYNLQVLMLGPVLRMV